MQDTPIIKVIGNLKPPAKEGDVGYNLPAIERTVVPCYGFAKVPTGIHIELPPGTWGMITPRSSTNIGAKLHVCTGIIDNGYRGVLFVFVHNLSDDDVVIEEGQSVAQMVIMPMIVPIIEKVEKLSNSERGSNGFGSSGR